MREAARRLRATCSSQASGTLRTHCGRIRYKRRKINLSQVFAGQDVGVKQVSDRIWLVTFMDYELGYVDDETCRLEPIANPFWPKCYLCARNKTPPMRPEWTYRGWRPTATRIGTRSTPSSSRGPGCGRSPTGPPDMAVKHARCASRHRDSSPRQAWNRLRGTACSVNPGPSACHGSLQAAPEHTANGLGRCCSNYPPAAEPTILSRRRNLFSDP